VLDVVAELSRPTAADGTADGKPLPGEEAALAAFRAVRAERAEQTKQTEQAARAGKAGRVGRATLRSVRFGADGGSRPRGTFRMAGPSDGQARLRRPLHMGLVAALAGCALSGFAVATAAGVLPFGPQDSAPGPSVSMPADTSGTPAEPNISPDGTTPGTGGSADNDASGGAWYGSGGSSTSPGQSHEAEGGTDGKGEGNNGKDDPSAPDSNAGGWVLNVCRDYLAAEGGDAEAVDVKDLLKLEKRAGSAAGIHGYCVAVVNNGGTSEGTPRSGDNNGDNSGGGTGDGGQGGDSGSGDSGSGDNDNGGGGDPGKGDGGTGTDNAPAPPPPPPPPQVPPVPTAPRKWRGQGTFPRPCPRPSLWACLWPTRGLRVAYL
ncbi:hypothetical protein AB4Z54_03655, partial [Streptomyces sp. MCAF7]